MSYGSGSYGSVSYGGNAPVFAAPTPLVLTHTVSDGATTSGTYTFTSGSITTADIGSTITSADFPYGTTILNVVGTTATTSKPATATGSGLAATININAPQNWTIEVWNKGATVRLDTLASPVFVAPTVDTLNSAAPFSFALGLYDAQAPHCDPRLGREVKVYRAGALRWAGAIWQDRVDFGAQTVTFDCRSLPDYFRDRFIDRGAARTNYLLNPSFEAGTTANWASTATTATVISSDRVNGTYAVQLVQGVDDADAHLSQDVTYTAGGLGDIVTLVFWVKVVAWTGPALANFGLTLVQLDGSGNVLMQPDGTTSFHSADVNYRTTRGQWVKLEVQTTVAANATVTLRASLYSPNGTVEWDEGFMGLYESLSLLNLEQASIGANIIAFLQDTTKGKDPVLIGSSTPSTGVSRDRTYQFADHVSGLSALTEFPRLVDGYDWQITPQRVFTTYALSGGGIGSDKTGTVTLTFGVNCEPVRQSFDGPQAASDVTTLANGSGPGREEAGAVDNTLYGGRTVQQVLPAPSVDTKIDSLGSWATRQLAIYRDPTTFEVIVTDRAVGFGLGIGDRVSLTASVGYVQESGHARVVRLAADPVTDLVTATLNRVP